MLNDVFSHPYIATPIAVAATINPWLTTMLGASLPVVVQILGAVFLIMQIYYLYRNKGKK